MIKIKLLGVGKSDTYSHYEFQKTQEVFEVIRVLLRELRFQQYVWGAVGRPENDDSSDAEDNIKEYIDRRDSFEENGTRVVVIYGKDKVFLSAYSDKETQKKITKTLTSFVED